MDPAITQPLIYGAILAMLAFVIDRRDRVRHEELKDRFDRFESRVDAEFARVGAEFAQVRTELAALRSDLTQVALALRIHPQTG